MRRKLFIGSWILTAFILFGCSNNYFHGEYDYTHHSQTVHKASPITLSLEIIRNAPVLNAEDKPLARNRWFASYPSGTQGDEISAEIQRLTGVSVQVTTHDEANVQIAAGELADMVLACGYENVLGSEQVCYPLDELAMKYEPEFWNDLEDMEKLRSQAADGHVYWLGSGYREERTYTSNDIPMGFDNPLYEDDVFSPPAVRVDLAERLDAGAVTSLEQIEDMLWEAYARRSELGIEHPLRFEDTYIANISLLSEHDLSTLDFMSMAYQRFPLAENMGLWQEPYWDGEQVRTPWDQEGWVCYFKLLNRWYREGMLEYEAKELLDYTLYQEGLEYEPITDALVCMGWQADAATQNARLRESNRGGFANDPAKPRYVPLSGVLTWQGEQMTVIADYGMPQFGLYISKNCKSPDRAISYMAFLKSPDGSKLTQWGIEGKHYASNEDGTITYMDTYADPMTQLYTVGLGRWDFLGKPWRSDISNASEVYNESDEHYCADMQLWFTGYKEYCEMANRVRDPAMGEALFTEAETEYNQYIRLGLEWHNRASKMILADSEQQVEQLWRQLLDWLESQGVSELENKLTERYTKAAQRYWNAGYYMGMETN